MTDDQDSLGDLKVEELSLEDLDATERKEEDKKGRGGLRAGGLGPEGSRYSPPETPRRRTWKPMVAAGLLFIAGFLGVYVIAYQLTIESSVEGDTFNLQGRVLDLDEAEENREIPVENVAVTIDGMDLTGVVSDEDGKFEVPDVPGGKFTIRFEKRMWDESVNTRYVTYIFGDYEDDERQNFFVEVKDLDAQHSEPTTDDPMTVQVDVIDWPSDDTVRLRVHASSFDADLSTHKIHLRESIDGQITILDYENEVDFRFSIDGNQSKLQVLVVDADGEEYVGWTDVSVPEHPKGDGGWLGTDYPEVALFLRVGSVTNSGTLRLAVHSNGATEYTYRVGTDDWGPWAALVDGHAEIEQDGFIFQGGTTVFVQTRNETGVNGTTNSVEFFRNIVPPYLDPKPAWGPAVTDEAVFSPQVGDDGRFLRYSLPDGTWSPWQLALEEVVVPIDDSGVDATVTFEVMDEAGNVASATGTVAITTLQEHEANDYDQYKSSLRLCLPVMVIGTLLAFLGGYMAWNRKRPTLAMLGAIGGLLATGFGIIGAVLAFAALALIMLSREEFEMPGPAPEE